MGRRLACSIAAAVVVLAGAGQARAAIKLTPCKTGGVECGTVSVPLDRSGSVSGAIPLHVEVLPANGTARGVAFLIAGGPGQGSSEAFDLSPGLNRDVMRFMLPGYTLVAFDNRGTGLSGLLDCPRLQATANASAEEGAALAAECAATIGPQRVFYATRDHAEDIDAVRAALGIDQVALFGVSYGTKLALAYALAHPTHVERLVLDSVVPPTLPDPFDSNVLREMSGTLRSFCGGGACQGATSNFGGDVVTLANKIEAKPIEGKIVASNGNLKTVRMNGEQLIEMLIDADLSPGLASEAPAAVHAALSGDVRPLLRIYDLDLIGNELSAKDLSFGLNAATNCADGLFPWSPGTPPSARRAAIDSAVAALPRGTLGGFGTWATRMGTAFFCEQWPSPSGSTPLGQGPYPNVPVLAISGGFDLRTPTTNALSVLGSFPQGRLLVVPGVGHSVTSPLSDTSACSQNAVRAWILGTLDAQARCPRVKPLVKVLTAFPRRPGGRSAQATLAIVGKAVREAESTWLQLIFSPKLFVPRGLYGGTLVDAKKGAGFTLTRYSIAPGVLVSGKLKFVALGPPTTYQGTIQVSGRAAVAGTLKITKSGAVSGTLGGHRVSGRY